MKKEKEKRQCPSCGSLQEVEKANGPFRVTTALKTIVLDGNFYTCHKCGNLIPEDEATASRVHDTLTDM